MKTKSISVMHSLAEYFYRDALDFSSRFDLLWEANSVMHKTGRIKTFTDLLMGCECALKCHCFLSHLEEEPAVIYGRIRGLGHNIANLADHATFHSNRNPYDHLKTQLTLIPIYLRYSLDAYEAFFPALLDRKDAKLSYTQTIGNNSWVLEIRNSLKILIDSVENQFGGIVTDDITVIFTHDEQMRNFAESCLKRSN